MTLPRTVVWFSCGAASAVAAKITLQETQDAILVYADTGSEHTDNERFLTECEAWLGAKVQRIKSEKYRDIWDVFATTRYLVGPRGARCTTELKKIPRFGFQSPDDIQVFGYTWGEQDRAERFKQQNAEVDMRTPLIEKGLEKRDCLELLARTGIALPVMYGLGYRNNNCIGCVKGGAGYWNKIRKDFPETFQRMALLERNIGATIIRKDGESVYLDELDPKAGRYEREEISCSLLCEGVIQ